MKNWFWTILTVTLAVLVAAAIHRFPGNVLIVVDQWRVQVSLAFAIVLVILAFVALYALIRVLVWLAQMPERYRGWRGKRQEKREQSLLEQGWTALLEGRYSHAEKTLTRLSGQSADKRRQVLATLSAARAAHEVGEYQRQDELIAQAQKAAANQTGDVDLNTAVAAAAADLWLEQGRAREALEALQVEHVQPLRHLHTMRLMLRVNQQTDNHAQVLELARALRRKKALSQSEADKIIETAASALIRGAAAVGDEQSAQSNQTDRTDQTQEVAANWEASWKALRSEEKILPEVALAGSEAFQQAGGYKDATKVLEAALKERFEPKLLEAYARAQDEQVGHRLQKAEQWLEQRKQQGKDNEPVYADLLTALGALCLAAQMWGQAQHYLEQSAKLRKDARVHALLGSLFDRIGQPQRAAQHWRLATAVSAALPTLAQDVVLPAAEIDADPVIAYGAELDLEDDLPDVREFTDKIDGKQIIGKPQTSSEYDELFDSAPIPIDYLEDLDKNTIDNQDNQDSKDSGDTEGGNDAKKTKRGADS